MRATVGEHFLAKRLIALRDCCPYEVQTTAHAAWVLLAPPFVSGTDEAG
jgi:hypothetical protein